MLVTSKGCEREQGAERGRRGEGREINFVVPRMFAARAAYATSANELPQVKSERFALRIKISRGLLLWPCALERERAEELAREGGYKKGEGGEGPKSTEEILIYTIGVLTSLKNGRLIAQSRIIRRFRVTKPRRGGLYQLDVCANTREKVKRREREGGYATREKGTDTGRWCAWGP